MEEEGILREASEVKELLVDKTDIEEENNDSSSTSSSSDEDEAPPADKFPRIESAVEPLNDNISSSSSSSSSSTDEEAPLEDFIIPTTHHSGPVAVSQVQGIPDTNSEVVLAKVMIDHESESSENNNDHKVLPIQDEEAEAEEETLVAAAAASLATAVLVSKETQDSPPQNIPIVESTLDQHTDKRDIPDSSAGSPVLITTVTHRVRSPTSWMSCCGLFDVLRRDR